MRAQGGRVVLSLLLVAGVLLLGATPKVSGIVSSIALFVNGNRVSAPVIIIEGRSFLPVRAISEALGATVEWSEPLNRIDVNKNPDSVVTEQITKLQSEVDRLRQIITSHDRERLDSNAILVQFNKKIAERDREIGELRAALSRGVVTVDQHVQGVVDWNSPIVDLRGLGIRYDEIDAFKLEKTGRLGSVPIVVRLINGRAIIGDHQTENILDPSQKYVLTAHTKVGRIYRLHFATSGLPTLLNSQSEQIIFIPAMPEKGFHWPYFLRIPSTAHRAENVSHRRYLVVDTTNTGVSSPNSFRACIQRTRDFISNPGYTSVRAAEMLWSPMLAPVFPRPHVDYSYKGEANILLTHSLDRDTARLHLKLEDPVVRQELIRQFERAGFDFELQTLARLDLQLIAMLDHAIEYLNQQGQKVELQRIFMVGYSASGTFNDRFATMHPERVKAVVSGATLDDMMLPLARHRGEELIFPIGTSDYKEITGREFSLTKHNQVARLIHMGEIDENDSLPYGDCYGARERGIITRLWGTNVLSRAKQLIELYGKSGGQGIFILDKGQGHSESGAMVGYIIDFLKANRDTDKPIYPLPSNYAQLMYTYFGPLQINAFQTPGQGVVGVAYSALLSASGGVAPYRWSMVSGTLPPGLRLSADGAVAGTPTATGVYSFTVEVVDSSVPVQVSRQIFSATVALTPPVATWRLSDPLYILFGENVGNPQEWQTLLARHHVFRIGTLGGSLEFILPRLKLYRTHIDSFHTILILNPHTTPPSRLADWPVDFSHLVPLGIDRLQGEVQGGPFMYATRCHFGRVRIILWATTNDQVQAALTRLATEGIPRDRVVRLAAQTP